MVEYQVTMADANRQVSDMANHHRAAPPRGQVKSRPTQTLKRGLPAT